jgi:hypothetical protein
MCVPAGIFCWLLANGNAEIAIQTIKIVVKNAVFILFIFLTPFF